MTYPLFGIVLAVCGLLGLLIAVFFLFIAPKILIRKYGKRGVVLSIVQITLFLVIFTTPFKWFYNELVLCSGSEGNPTSMRASIKKDVFVAKFNAEPNCFLLDENWVCIEEIWMERVYKHKWKLIWFYRKEIKEEYHLVVTTSPSEYSHYRNKFSVYDSGYMDGKKQRNSTCGNRIWFNFDDLPPDNMTIEAIDKSGVVSKVNISKF